MTELLENVELADKNTFRLPAKARYYAEFSTVEELKDRVMKDMRYGEEYLKNHPFDER